MPGRIWRDTTQEQRDAALLEQTACGTAGSTSGLIGYVDGEAAGWVAHVAGVGALSLRRDVTSAELPFVSFRQTYAFPDGTQIVSDSTLRFGSQEEFDVLLDQAGFSVLDVRDAPDRPGREFVFVAQS